MHTPTEQAAQQDPSTEQKQKQSENNAKRYLAGKAAVARVAELEALKEQGPLTEEQEAELSELRPKAQQWQKQSENNAKRYRAGKAAVARVAELEALKEQGPLTEEQEAELAELQPKAQQWQKKKESAVNYRRAGKAAVARVAVLEALAEQGPLTEEQEVELAGLQPKVAQQKQKQKERGTDRYRAGKAAVARVAELEASAEQGPLTEEQEVELAGLQPKVAQQKQKKKDEKAKYRRAGKAAVARVAELEASAEQGPLTEEQEVELAGLQPKVAQWQKQKESDAARYRAGIAAVARVAELEALAEQGPLTEEQEAELAGLQPKVAQWHKKKESDAARYRAGMAAVARVAELEALKERGPLTVEQEAELAELRPKAQQWRKKKESAVNYRRTGKAAVARVAELEALAEQGPLTEEQEVELKELQPEAAHQKQKQREFATDWYRAGKVAAARVAVLEALDERGPLTVEQEVELAELRPKAQQWQKKKEREADRYRAGKAAAARVAELEALKERGPLTVEQEVELAELRPKAQQWQKKKESGVDYRREGMAAAARVAELEVLREQGPLTVEQEVELAELQPKAQQRQKEKERDAEWHRVRKAAARVAMLEALKEQGRLTDEQEAELAELRSKVAGRGRKKKDRDVPETGVGGPVVGRRVGPEEVSGWIGADQDDLDGWSAEVDLGGWLAGAVADVDGVQVPRGAADAGAMLGEGAYEEFVATELSAFLGQDAGDDAAGVGGAGSVAGVDDFAGFLPDYTEGEGSDGFFGGEGPDGPSFGEPFPEDAVSPDAGDTAESGVWGVADPVAGVGRLGLGIGSCRG